MHNKRTCKDVCKFLNCTVFLQDFRGAISESLKISTVSATFIPFIMYWNCNRLARGGGGRLELLFTMSVSCKHAHSSRSALVI